MRASSLPLSQVLAASLGQRQAAVLVDHGLELGRQALVLLLVHQDGERGLREAGQVGGALDVVLGDLVDLDRRQDLHGAIAPSITPLRCPR